MEPFENKSKIDRRSVCVPIPTIVLNTSASEKSEQMMTLVHSMSDGDLNMTVDATAECSSKFMGSDADGKLIAEDEAVGLYCSPRLSRRFGRSASDTSLRQCGMSVASLNVCNTDCLGPGSMTGSTISLNSEYTSRSVGLISNDSLSECGNTLCNAGVMDGSIAKHSVLKRFHSSPERDDDLPQCTSAVRRNSKSMGNMQENESCLCFEFGSDSADGNSHQNEEYCHIDNSLAQRTALDEAEIQSERCFITSITGGAELCEGRIRKWLTEISDPVANYNDS